jgi:hypothetical protein
MWLAVGVLVLVLVIVLEGKRQARHYGKPSGRPNLGGAGMLEVQSLIEADRRVETLVRQDKGQEVADAEQDESGDGPKSGRP